MIHNGVNKKKSIHSHLNYDRQLQVYKNINVLMTWNIIWQVSRSIFGLHRVMSLGCRLRVRGCLLLPASQSLLVIVGSQVTLVSGNRSSWKYSNYTCKLKFTLNFLYTVTFIHVCVLKNCSDTMCIQHINWAFLQKCMRNHCEVKLAFFLSLSYCQSAYLNSIQFVLLIKCTAFACFRIMNYFPSCDII